MAKGNPFGAKKAPPFGKGKVAREAKAEGESPKQEKAEMAAGFRKGGRAGKK
jgi:hypothetical protein